MNRKVSVAWMSPSAAARLTPAERKLIDELLEQGHGVLILRARDGRVISARVTDDGEFRERWCN